MDWCAAVKLAPAVGGRGSHGSTLRHRRLAGGALVSV